MNFQKSRIKNENPREKKQIIDDVIESYKKNIGFAYDVAKAVIPDLTVFSDGNYLLVGCSFKDLVHFNFTYQISSDDSDLKLFEEPYEIRSEEIRNLLLLEKM